MTDHWLDRLSQYLGRRVSRRQALGLAGLLPASLALGGTTEVGARDKKKPKTKPKKPKKPKKKDPCDKEFRSERNRDWCRFIRRQCKKGPIKQTFCIVEGDPSDPAKIALCCGAGQVCCKENCCGPFYQPTGFEPGRCCPGNPPTRTCLPASWTCCPGNPPDAINHGAPSGSSCCPHDRRGYCPANQFCCPGVGCVTLNTRENCGGCGVHCGALACLDDATCGCPAPFDICDGPVCYDTRNHCCKDGNVVDIRTGLCP